VFFFFFLSKKYFNQQLYIQQKILTKHGQFSSKETSGYYQTFSIWIALQK